MNYFRNLPPVLKDATGDVIRDMVRWVKEGTSRKDKVEYMKRWLKELDSDLHDEVETEMTLLISALVKSIDKDKAETLKNFSFPLIAILFDMAWIGGRHYQRTQEFKTVKKDKGHEEI